MQPSVSVRGSLLPPRGIRFGLSLFSLRRSPKNSGPHRLSWPATLTNPAQSILAASAFDLVCRLFWRSTSRGRSRFAHPRVLAAAPAGGAAPCQASGGVVEAGLEAGLQVGSGLDWRCSGRRGQEGG